MGEGIEEVNSESEEFEEEPEEDLDDKIIEDIRKRLTLPLTTARVFQRY
jgi:hypothetical protein